MKRIAKIFIHVIILFSIYKIGSFIQDLFNLFIPGSVIGLFLLFTLLMTNTLKPALLEDGATFLVRHMILFFIPPTVGLIHYFDLFIGKGLLLVVITISSTILVIGCSGALSQALYKRNGFTND